MENGAFALLEQILNFPEHFRKYSKLNLKVLWTFKKTFFKLLLIKN